MDKIKLPIFLLSYTNFFNFDSNSKISCYAFFGKEFKVSSETIV
jgi:hypothetical protein